MLSGYSNSIISNYKITPVMAAKQGVSKPVMENTRTTSPSFKGGNEGASNISVRTSLSTKEEKAEYNYLTKHLDKDSKKTLNMLLRSGVLLRNDSNDGSTTLENLYKMMSTPRAEGMSPELLLKHTIRTLMQPSMLRPAQSIKNYCWAMAILPFCFHRMDICRSYVSINPYPLRKW